MCNVIEPYFNKLSLQITRPLNYTKRQFDVEEEDVDKLALRCVLCEHQCGHAVIEK